MSDKGSIKIVKKKHKKASLVGPWEIYWYPINKKILKKKSKPVKDLDEVKDLYEYMQRVVADRQNNALGLAAIQLGIQSQIIAIRLSEKPYYDKAIVLINPQVVETRGPDIVHQEGCLSLPGRWFTVTRPKFVTVSYTKPGVGEVTYTFQNYDARVILHEMDHLEGKLLINVGKEGKK